MENEMLAIYKPGNYRKGVYLSYNNEIRVVVDGEYTWPNEEEFTRRDKIDGMVTKFLKDKSTGREIRCIQREVKRLYDTL